MAENAALGTPADRSTLVAELYRERRDEIYRHLVAHGVRAEVAQEFTHEAFLRLHEALLAGQTIRNHMAWVYTVAHNLAANSRRRLPELDLNENFDVASTAEADNPEALLLKSERMARVDRAFVGLSGQQRLCLSLRVEGFEYKQIARITGLGVSTVGEFLQRAIRKLRDSLHE